MSRTNPRSAYDTPPGYFLCPHGPCVELVAVEPLEREWVACAAGHRFALVELERAAYEPGGWTHVGLTCTEQGELDYPTCTAEVWLRGMERSHYWYRRGEPFARVSFESPFERAA